HRLDKPQDAYQRDLVAIANGYKFPTLRSVILCTEDAIRADQLADALDNLKVVLPQVVQSGKKLMVFIRTRCPGTLTTLLQMRGLGNGDGFVLPKVHRRNIFEYRGQFASHDDRFKVMPTLETGEAFDEYEMKKLRGILMKDGFRKRILSLRIGGNDLL